MVGSCLCPGSGVVHGRTEELFAFAPGSRDHSEHICPGVYHIHPAIAKQPTAEHSRTQHVFVHCSTGTCTLTNMRSPLRFCFFSTTESGLLATVILFAATPLLSASPPKASPPPALEALRSACNFSSFSLRTAS